MILCAALKINSSLFPEGELVLPCRRHEDGYAILFALAPVILTDARERNTVTEGFIDSAGAFLGRAEALTAAMTCGQLPESLLEQKRIARESVLYSEDLY